MVVQELFNVGTEFLNEGRLETAMDIYSKVIARDPNFGPVYLNQHNVYRAQGNLLKAKEALIRFLNCPLTGMTIDIIPGIKTQLAQIDQQLNPQVPPQVK